jgi:hypothetical protein
MPKTKLKKKTPKPDTTTARATKKAPEQPRTNQKKIMVARTGDVREVSFREGITVKDALAEAQFTLDGASEIRVNNILCKNQKTHLKAGDQVLILGNIRGA